MDLNIGLVTLVTQGRYFLYFVPKLERISEWKITVRCVVGPENRNE